MYLSVLSLAAVNSRMGFLCDIGSPVGGVGHLTGPLSVGWFSGYGVSTPPSQLARPLACPHMIDNSQRWWWKTPQAGLRRVGRIW